MYKLCLFVFGVFLSNCHFAQSEVYKFTTLFVQGNLGNEIEFNENKLVLKELNFSSISAGVGVPGVHAPNFHHEWRFAYRYFENYTDNIIFAGNGLKEDTLDYHGLYISPSFYIGRIHQWELVFPIGGGLLERNNKLTDLGAMEMSILSGYRFISSNGIMLRVGGALHFGKNGFDRVLYSGYLSAGFAFRNPVRSDDFDGTRYKGYAAISLNPYIGSITGDIIGSNFQIEHVFLNYNHVKLGYTLAGRFGAPWGDDPQFSCSAALMILTGKNKHKFEMTLGPNFPFGADGIPDAEWFQMIHYGMGYRYAPDDSRFFMRLGSATTQILYLGAGIVLGAREN